MGDAPAVDGDLGRGAESADNDGFDSRLCSHGRLSRMMTGNESAVWPRRQQRTLAGAYLGHERTAAMERTARRNVGWTWQFTAQHQAPLGALRDRVWFGHRRHQCPCIGMLGSGEEDVAGCLLNDAAEIHHRHLV